MRCLEPIEPRSASAARPPRRSGRSKWSNEGERPQKRAAGEAFMLDTSALLLGFSSPGAALYTTETAVREVRYDELRVARVEALINSGALNIAHPSKEAVDVVRKTTETLGEKLSVTDLELAAAALDIKKRHRAVTIITDDYALQNIAAHLGLGFAGLKHPGIRKLIRRMSPEKPPNTPKTKHGNRA